MKTVAVCPNPGAEPGSAQQTSPAIFMAMASVSTRPQNFHDQATLCGLGTLPASQLCSLMRDRASSSRNHELQRWGLRLLTASILSCLYPFVLLPPYPLRPPAHLLTPLPLLPGWNPWLWPPALQSSLHVASLEQFFKNRLSVLVLGSKIGSGLPPFEASCAAKIPPHLPFYPLASPAPNMAPFLTVPGCDLTILWTWPVPPRALG